MLESIRRGFGFLGQAVDMARKDGDLIKPSFYGMVVGALASLAGAVPIIAAALLIPGDVGQWVTYLLGALLIFVQYAIAYIFSGMTAHLVYGYLTEGDARMDRAWAIVQRDWLDILSLAGASTLVKIVEGLVRGRGRNPLRDLLANLLETVWTTATYFVLPAMVIEDLNLVQGVRRATEIIKKNLLLVAVTEIGVSGVVGLIGGVLGVLAVILGVVIFVGFASLAGEGNLLPLILSGGLAALVAGGLLAVITALSSYVTTAYHTCMFLWARNAERAVAQGQSAQSVSAPAPLAAVLGAAPA